MKQTKRKLLSGLLAVALLLQLTLPATVFAAETAPKTIVGFSALEKSEYTLPIGADEAAANTLLATFPENVTANAEYMVTEEMPPVADSGDEKTTLVKKTSSEQVDLPVTWTSDKPLSTEKAGTFTYTAALSESDKGRYGFAAGVTLPKITVTVGASVMVRNAGTIYHVNTNYTGINSDGSVENPYSTLDAARAAIGSTDGCTIKLLSNVNIGGTFIVSGVSLALDLNGQTLSSPASPALKYDNADGKTLTVMDSGTGGRLENTYTNWTIENRSTGTVVITGGTIYSKGAPPVINYNGGSFIITGGAIERGDSGPVIKLTNGELEISGTADIAGGVELSGTCSADISGGKIHDDKLPSRYAVQHNGTGLITISGNAELSSSGGYVIDLKASGTAPDDRLVITGGTVKANTANVASAIRNASTGGVNISGGTMITNNTYISSYTVDNVSTGALTITGGAVVNQTGGSAVRNFSTGTLTYTGGLIWGITGGAVPANMAWSMKGDQTLSVDATLPTNKTFTIPSGVALTIAQGATLTIAQGATLTNNGALLMGGGTLNGTVTGNQPVKLGEHDISTGSIEIASDGYTVNGTKIFYNGDYIITGTSANNTISVTGGTKNITLKDVTITSWLSSPLALTNNANVTLTLDGSNTLTASVMGAGISVPTGTTLKITGAGSLAATSKYSPGIGDDVGGCGAITINGGTVIATGGLYTVGIGSHSNYSGSITITGGHVTATGGDMAAGIGSGSGAEAGSRIVISGGTVIANGGDNGGAGIGGGFGYAGAIEITGGHVTATGGESGSGIGFGFNSTGSLSISGGTVIAKSNSGVAGINVSDTGNFNTGTDGNAFIKASGGNTAISNPAYKTDPATSGVIFEDAAGTVYGSPTLPEDTAIASGETLTVPAGKTLTIGTGKTLTNEGTLTVEGELVVDGTLAGDGTFRTTVLKPEDITIGDLAYTGAAISPNPTIAKTRTIDGKTFAVDASGYGVTYNPAEVKNVGPYKVIYTKTADPAATVEKTFNVTKSASALGLTTDQTSYTYGESIVFTANVSIPASNSSRAAAVNTVDFYCGGTKLNDTPIALTESNGTGTAVFTYNTGAKKIPVGTQTITAEYGGSGNLNGKTETISVTLNKKALTATTAGFDASTSKTYDGTNIFTDVLLTLTGIVGGSGDTVTAKANGTTADANAGTAKAFTATAVTLSDAQAAYYSLATTAVGGNVEITTKAVTNPTITLAQTSLPYDGTAKTPAVSSVKDGTTTIPSSEYTVSYSNHTNVGTATVSITDAAGGNYAVSGSTTFEITKAAQAALTITGKPNSIAYADTFTLGTDGGSGSGAVTWAVTSGGSFATVNSSTGAVNITGVGEVTVTATKAGGSGYEAATATLSFTSVRADQTAFRIDEVTGKKFNDAPFALTTTGGGSSGAVSFSVPAGNGVLTVNGATATVIGVGTVTVTATKAADSNYNAATATRDITIAKAAAPTITYPAAGNLTYGQKLSASALTGGSTAFGSFAWQDGSTVPTAANSGCPVKFTPSEATLKNYEAITNLVQNVPVTVTKTAPAINLTATLGEAGGSKQATLTATLAKVGDGELPTGTVKFVETTSGSAVDISGAATVTIANGVATYTWTGFAAQVHKVKAVYSGSDNYNAATSTEISFDARKQNQQGFAVAAIGAKTYGDSSFALAATGGNGSGAVSFVSSNPAIVSISGSTATIHKAGNVTITATKAADSSFNEATAVESLVVSKKAISFIANHVPNVMKGSAMPIFTYKPVTLAAGDSITTQPTLATTATDTNTPGTFAITISGAVVTNADSYTITYVNGEMTIVEQFYTVTVQDGTGGGQYSKGQTVSITANDKSGYTFTGWSSADGVTFANSSAKSTTFVMPDQNVTVTANYSSNSGGGGGSSSGGGNTTVTTPPATSDNPNPPTQGSITVPPTISGDKATVTVPEATVKDAISKAQAEAKKNGKTDNGISVEIKADTKNAQNLVANLPKATVDALVSANVKETRITSGVATISLSLDALKEVQKQVNGDTFVTATKVENSTLAAAAKALVGNRPVYDLSITGRNGTKVQSVGEGTVSVAIPYTLGANEKAGSVAAYEIGGNGEATEMANSVYDAESKTLSFVTSHLSVYAVGYKTNTVSFTDIANHWAKDSIEFVAAHGLLNGTSKTTFSPNSSMTRGMFVTALGRLAGADVSSYKQSSFTDVNADIYYLGYIEWAVKSNIVQGAGNGKFAPDQAISREQMAVIMHNYAKAIGFELPRAHAQNTFADDAKISAYAKEAVKIMQMAGVLAGKSGNEFDPQGTATRAEVSVVLKRFVELARANGKTTFSVMY